MRAEHAAGLGRVTAELLRRTSLSYPEDLPALLANAVRHLGVDGVQVLLVDHAQTTLMPMPPPGEDAGPPLELEGTTAGRSFRRIEVQQVPADAGGVRVWLPLLDGVERLGVVAYDVQEAPPSLVDALRHVSSLAAELVISRRQLGDAFTATARRQPMELAAEVQWGLMPPLTVATEGVAIAGMLEPCYEVGGDVFDYALSRGRVELAVFDAMGHGFGASLLASIAVGAYRNARRNGWSLRAAAEHIDRAVEEPFPEVRFVTALLCELDLETGRLDWACCGHPPPVLLRRGQVIGQLEADPDPPLGLGWTAAGELVMNTDHLQPGDRLLCFTDGVIEARAADGSQFGVDRLADFAAKAEASQEALPETMRRLSRAVLDWQQGDLADDATHLLLEWRPDRIEQLAP